VEVAEDAAGAVEERADLCCNLQSIYLWIIAVEVADAPNVERKERQLFLRLRETDIGIIDRAAATAPWETSGLDERGCG
jgi:hypothetical protein